MKNRNFLFISIVFYKLPLKLDSIEYVLLYCKTKRQYLLAYLHSSIPFQ